MRLYKRWSKVLSELKQTFWKRFKWTSHMAFCRDHIHLKSHKINSTSNFVISTLLNNVGLGRSRKKLLPKNSSDNTVISQVIAMQVYVPMFGTSDQKVWEDRSPTISDLKAGPWLVTLWEKSHTDSHCWLLLWVKAGHRRSRASSAPALLSRDQMSSWLCATVLHWQLPMPFLVQILDLDHRNTEWLRYLRKGPLGII